MSEPKRYLAKCPWYAIETQEHPMGEFVLYADYARLKAQAEMWEKNTQLMGRQLNDVLEEVARLKAEVERLTKAGDEMAFHFHQLELRVGNYSFSVKAPSIQAWEKAKEVQS